VTQTIWKSFRATDKYLYQRQMTIRRNHVTSETRFGDCLEFFNLSRISTRMIEECNSAMLQHSYRAKFPQQISRGILTWEKNSIGYLACHSITWFQFQVTIYDRQYQAYHMNDREHTDETNQTLATFLNDCTNLHR
jgi:hypothetical protein